MMILKTMFSFDGVMARRHLKVHFWPRTSWQAMERRLSILYHNSYLDWPTIAHRRHNAIPEPIVWLGWKGALMVAASLGVTVPAPANDGENQLRILACRLRTAGFIWRREPRWIQLSHDLAVIDFRLAVENAVLDLPHLRLESWLHETEFRSRPDTVVFRPPTRRGHRREARKQVIPDSFFVITDDSRLQRGEPARACFLLELDNGTHPGTRFGEEKVAPGIPYIQSEVYRRRFGHNTGRWLVVTSGTIRLRNLMRQTHRVARANCRMFYFTCLEQTPIANVLTDAIWWQVGVDKPVALMPAAYEVPPLH